MCLFALIFRKGGHPIMPKTKLQNIIFTLIMAFVMVYAMVCYNIALEKGAELPHGAVLAAVLCWPIGAVCIRTDFPRKSNCSSSTANHTAIPLKMNNIRMQ